MESDDEEKENKKVEKWVDGSRARHLNFDVARVG